VLTQLDQMAAQIISEAGGIEKALRNASEEYEEEIYTRERTSVLF
jgi:hypothetical protein